jgi:hypothetical protein
MELEWLINKLSNTLFDTLQKNELFFSMVKTAFKANRTVDWAFKTSFLYLGGYSENLRQSPVAFKDQIDNVVAYLEEVKPYHVKIREYVRRLSYGPDVAKLAVIDFDKPAYVEKTQNGPLPARKLDVNNSSDVAILRTQTPWKFWYENYQKTNYNLALWNSEWNPVRRLRSRILIDRVSCSAIRGWDTSPWDPPLTFYSQKDPRIQSISTLSWKYRNEYLWDESTQKHFTDAAHLHQQFYFNNANRFGDTAVDTIADRDSMLQAGQVTTNNQGTIVVVRADETRWMWSGRTWLQFEATGWDQDISYGAAGRIGRFYNPMPGMEPINSPGLIEGCDFTGTVITNSFQDGAWDMFEWDNAGWGSELADHTGYDPDKIVDQPTSSDDSSNIVVQGNGFAQPGVSGKSAAEQMLFVGKDFLNITVKKKTSGVEAPELRFTKSQIDGWDLQNISASGASVVNWNQTDKKLTIHAPSSSFPFHDPDNPTQAYMDKVKNMLGFYSTSSNDMTLGDKTFQLRDVDGTVVDRIPAGLAGNGIRVVLENRDKTSERMIGTININSKGLEDALWEGDLHVTITGYVGAAPSSPSTARTKWNIIPLELFAPKGAIWVGQAKFTYTKVEAGQNANEFVLSDARVDGSSLAGVTVSGDHRTISLPANQPVYDASMMYRIVK